MFIVLELCSAEIEAFIPQQKNPCTATHNIDWKSALVGANAFSIRKHCTWSLRESEEQKRPEYPQDPACSSNHQAITLSVTYEAANLSVRIEGLQGPGLPYVQAGYLLGYR